MMDTLFDVELSRLLAGEKVAGSVIVDDHADIPNKSSGYAEHEGLLTLAGEWKLPKGILQAPVPPNTPRHIVWELPDNVFPGGDRGPGGLKAGMKATLFDDSRFETTGTYIIRSRTKHSYYSVRGFMHFRYNTSNHPVPEFGRGGVAGGYGLRHGGGGWREYPYVTSNYWREAAANFDSLLRADIDAWLTVVTDRER